MPLKCSLCIKLFCGKGFITCNKCKNNYCFKCLNTQTYSYRYPCNCKKIKIKKFVKYKDCHLRDFIGTIVELKDYIYSSSDWISFEKGVYIGLISEDVTSWNVVRGNKLGPKVDILIKEDSSSSFNCLLECHSPKLQIKHTEDKTIKKIIKLLNDKKVKFSFLESKDIDIKSFNKF